MNQPSIEYFAGLFDGEGCISIYRAKPDWVNKRSVSPKYELRLSIRMTDPRALYTFRNYFKDMLYYKTEKREDRNWKAIHQIDCFGQRAEDIIKVLLPYLIIKKEEAELALKFREYMKQSNCSHKVGFARRPVPDYILQKRHSFYLKAKQLKARQIPYPSS